MGLTIRERIIPLVAHAPWQRALQEFYQEPDPAAAIQSGRVMAKAWVKTLPEKRHMASVQAFVVQLMESYWNSVHGGKRPLPLLFSPLEVVVLDDSVSGVAKAMGSAAAKLSLIDTSYLLGNVYTLWKF